LTINFNLTVTMGLRAKWLEFRKKETNKRREDFRQYAIKEANRRFNLVNNGYNMITFDGYVVSLSVDDADQKQLCERLCELREEFIRKLMDESGLWKHTENI